MKKSTGEKGKVFVGLSGGVDSSVSAALLKKEGYDVTGVFIKVWQPDFLPCTWKDDRLDAMRVAAHLDIPFITLDLEEEYKRDVVDYMIAEYKAGRTPNPDVMCNKYIKFGAFFRRARTMGADYVATGHYARVEHKDGRARLLAGIDHAKDQSYFLWTLTQEELTRTLMPVGGYEKKATRTLAKKFGLPTAEKKDSQGLCFMGKLDMKAFLQEFIPSKEGEVLDEKGEAIGTHDGVWYFTTGQRHGFTVTKKSTNDTPLYVVAKNVEHNTITVSPKEAVEQKSGRTTVALEQVNWIAESPEEGKQYHASVRYHGQRLPCTVSKEGADWNVSFTEPHMAPSGQSLVLYDGDVCLGGGVMC